MPNLLQHTTFRHYIQSTSHDKLKSKLSCIVDFAFKEGDKTFIRLSNNGAGFCVKKTKGGLAFNKASLKTAINHLAENCYFNVGSVTMKQATLGKIDSASFWANLFLYFYEEQYMSSLISSDKIKTRHFHSTKRFIDDLCVINDGGEFEKSIYVIYPKDIR